METKRGAPPAPHPVWGLLGRALEVSPSFLIFSVVGPMQTFHISDTPKSFRENSISGHKEDRAEKRVSVGKKCVFLINKLNKDDSWFDTDRARAGSLWRHIRQRNVLPYHYSTSLNKDDSGLDTDRVCYVHYELQGDCTVSIVILIYHWKNKCPCLTIFIP